MAEEKDNVNHPKHYTGRYECINVMEDVFGKEELKTFCVMNAFKYLYRFKNKNGIEDIKKAKWYIDKYLSIEDKMIIPNDETINTIVNLDSFQEKIEEKEENTVGYIGNNGFIVINKDSVIAEDYIDKGRFDGNSNDYEKSEIRQYLLNWYFINKDEINKLSKEEKNNE